MLSSEVIEKGGIPVLSANVNKSFGFIKKSLITDFSVPSILWGIDGDWMVNYLAPNKPFYPTDHCGVLRVLDHDIIPRYLAGILDRTGKEKGFSRSLRASIDRIEGISVTLPDKVIQERIVSEIQTIETKIAEAYDVIKEAVIEKQSILDKYL